MASRDTSSMASSYLEFKMASVPYVIQDVGNDGGCDEEVFVEEVEVGNLPITDIDDDTDLVLDAQPIVVLEGFPDDFQGEVELQPAEEIVDEGCRLGTYEEDENIGLGSCISIGEPEVGLDAFSEYVLSTPPLSEAPKRIGRGRSRKQMTAINRVDHQLLEQPAIMGDLSLTALDSGRRWEKKQVQIRTPDGESSVTMWASGPYSSSIFFHYFQIL